MVVFDETEFIKFKVSNAINKTNASKQPKIPYPYQPMDL
jgi:hypothetical protein